MQLVTSAFLESCGYGILNVRYLTSLKCVGICQATAWSVSLRIYISWEWANRCIQCLWDPKWNFSKWKMWFNFQRTCVHLKVLQRIARDSVLPSRHYHINVRCGFLRAYLRFSSIVIAIENGAQPSLCFTCSNLYPTCTIRVLWTCEKIYI